MSFLEKVKSTQLKDEIKSSKPKEKINPLLNKKKESESKGEPKKKINPLLAALNKKKESEPKKEDEKKNVFAKPKEKEVEVKKDIKINGETIIKKDEKIKADLDKEDIKELKEKKIAEEIIEKEAEKKEQLKEDKTSKKESDKNKENESPKPKEKDEKRNNKKNKKEKTTIDEVEATDNVETIKNFNKAVEAIKSTFQDPEWDRYTKDIKEDLSKIIIEADMTSAQLKSVMADLTKLRDKIWLEYLDYKTEFEILAGDKPEGKIERIKKTSFTSKDKNDFDRKKAGILACINYVAEQDGKKKIVNLFEICDEYRKRFNFLSEVMKQISFKADALIKMSTGIKLQNSINQ